MSELPDYDIIGAEEHPADSSVRLNGPPGTGKTTQSALRVGTLLEEHDYQLSNVLWATYRHSLAMDTLERLAEWGVIPTSELSDPSEGATKYISTIHAVANRLVGGAGDIVNGQDKYQFAQERNLRYKKQNRWDEPPGRLLFDVFDYAAENRLDLFDQHDVEQIPKIEDLRDEYSGHIGRAFDEWQDYKAQEGKIDFWEQLAAPLRNGVTPPHDIIVIDEYHDATPLMAELSEMWIDSAEIAIVAGDPLQVVNTYAGASPEFYHAVDLPEVLLDVTHRVPEGSWAAATSVLSTAHDPPAVERKKTGSFHEADSPGFQHSDGDGWRVPGEETPRSPAWMVERFGEDMMFLTRTQRQADGIAYALEQAGILYETQRSMDRAGWGAQEGMSERTAVYNALQRLRDVRPPGNTGHGLSAYMNRADGLTADDVTLRAREASALLDHAAAKHLTNSRSDTTEYVDAINNEDNTVGGAELAEYVKDSFWKTYSRGRGAVRHLNKSSNADEGSKLNDRDFKALMAALDRNTDPVRSVDTKVYTIHASKGTEAKSVVVYDGITGRIYDAMAEKDSEWRNEYRTWYVALTRASKNTFVLRNAFEWTQAFLPANIFSVAERAHKEVPTA